MPDGFGDDQAAVLPNPAVAAYQAAPVRGTEAGATRAGLQPWGPGRHFGAVPAGAVTCLPRLSAISGVWRT
jgi:hypothetical protein